MDLKIKIIDRIPKKFNDNKFLSIKGKIEIGDFWEYFYAPLVWWSAEDYERQWEEGLARLKSYDTSCLIISIYNPKITQFVNWWLLYKIDGKVYIRNQMLMNEVYEKLVGNNNFTKETCYNFIFPRNAKRKVSEWVIDYP
jgi:CdiI N-terminal domain